MKQQTWRIEDGRGTKLTAITTPYSVVNMMLTPDGIETGWMTRKQGAALFRYYRRSGWTITRVRFTAEVR